ncbi:hypothetical protein NECID01_0969 [Nematocida sp. AWRm77]|nr:hypothetical protein NECID01_0969 [Nematocida sp. AWRm77]
MQKHILYLCICIFYLGIVGSSYVPCPLEPTVIVIPQNSNGALNNSSDEEYNESCYMELKEIKVHETTKMLAASEKQKQKNAEENEIEYIKEENEIKYSKEEKKIEEPLLPSKPSLCRRVCSCILMPLVCLYRGFLWLAA